jgi:cytoskeletal protein RodZ
MTDFFRRFRGLGIAAVVLALSATAAFAAAPRATPSTSGSVGPTTSESAEPSESPEPSESAEPSDAPDASESDSPEPSDSAKTPDSPNAASTADTGQQGDHGALVSAAANMATPAGFVNHGAFVSCVAHLDATVATIDWTTVTPASCGQAPQGAAAAGQSPKGHGHGHGHGRPSWAGKPGS